MAKNVDPVLASFRAALLAQGSKPSGNRPPQAKPAADALEPHKIQPEGARSADAPAQVAPPAVAQKAAAPAAKAAAPIVGRVSVGHHINPSRSSFVFREVRADDSLGPEITVHGSNLDAAVVNIEIGTLENSHIVVDDLTVSKRHAAIKLCRTVCMIVDCGSQGTYVNGKRISMWGAGPSIKQGDEIRVGDVKLMVTKIEWSPDASASEPTHAAASVQTSAAPPARAAPVQESAPIVRVSALANAKESSSFIGFSELRPDGPAFEEIKVWHRPYLKRDIISIGKLPYSVVYIDDPSVSEMHALIELTDTDCHIVDLGSSNGTYVNGIRTTKGPIRKGDELMFGSVRVKLTRIVRRDDGTSTSEPAHTAVPLRPLATKLEHPLAVAAQQASRPAPVRPPVPMVQRPAVPPARAAPVRPPAPTKRAAPVASEESEQELGRFQKPGKTFWNSERQIAAQIILTLIGLPLVGYGVLAFLNWLITPK